MHITFVLHCKYFFGQYFKYGNEGGETITWWRRTYPGAMNLVYVHLYANDYDGNEHDPNYPTKRGKAIGLSGVRVAFLDGNTTDTPVITVEVAEKYRKNSVRGRYVN